MKTFTIEELRSWGPCYDPVRYLPEGWSGTVMDVLNLKECPFQDRLWVIAHTGLVSEKLMRLFAVWSARQVQHLMTDPRSLAALDVAERFANGEVDESVLSAARSAARFATWSATWSAAGAAAAVVWSVAAAAASATAWSAASAAESAESAASAQETKLREMLIAGIETGDTK